MGGDDRLVNCCVGLLQLDDLIDCLSRFLFFFLRTPFPLSLPLDTFYGSGARIDTF